MASEIKVDTISEKTSAGGVTIDGLLIKDGNISGDVALAGTTPTFTIGDAGAEDAALVFDGNAQDFYIVLDDSADDLLIGLGSTVGTTPAISINSDRDVTISDGAIDFDIASHDTSNGLKLGGTLVTATAAELNIMDGVTTTAAEINLIDGGTARGTTALADGDGILINDAGTMRMTNVTTVKTYMGGGDNSPQFAAMMTSDQAISDVTYTKANMVNEIYDPQSTYDATNARWTPGVAGKYFMYFRTFMDFVSAGEGKLFFAAIKKDGSNYIREVYWDASTQDQKKIQLTMATIIDVGANDYFEVWVYADDLGVSGLNLKANTGAGDAGAIAEFGGFKLIQS